MSASQPSAIPSGPQMNALKHGLRSSAILLPGDDAAEFRALRRDLFHTYQPGTRDEADCVENMAGYKWRMARCRRMQATYDTALDALLSGAPAGHICEPDPHRWQHRSMDCVLEEQRLHKLLTRDRMTLFELQRMRRNRLIDGALTHAADYRTFLGEEEPEEAGEKEAPLTPSVDRAIEDFRERTEQVVTALPWFRAIERGAVPSEQSLTGG